MTKTSNDKHHFAAMIPAAGFSSRMGRFKPLLPMGHGALIERCIRLFQGVGVTDIVAVVGHEAQHLIPVIEKLNARYVINPAYATGMFSSIKAGIQALMAEAQDDHGKAFTSFFMLPADIPLVRPQTLSAMMDAYQRKRRSVIYPTYGGERGHPPLIDFSLAPEIEAWTGDGGLRSFLDTKKRLAFDLKVPDSFIMMDCDTPDDYRMLLGRCNRYDTLTEEECRELMSQYRQPTHPVARHCEAVSRVAAKIARALNASACPVDEDLIVAAALLHDIMRDRPDHARAAAKFFTRLGYPKVADVVGCHMDIQIDEAAPIDAREVVYLADKLVREDRVVMLEKRFAGRNASLQAPEARKAFETRKRNAFRIKDRIEKQIARPLEEVLEVMPSVDKSPGGVHDLPA